MVLRIIFIGVFLESSMEFPRRLVRDHLVVDILSTVHPLSGAQQFIDLLDEIPPSDTTIFYLGPEVQMHTAGLSSLILHAATHPEERFRVCGETGSIQTILGLTHIENPYQPCRNLRICKTCDAISCPYRK